MYSGGYLKDKGIFRVKGTGKGTFQGITSQRKTEVALEGECGWQEL